MEHYPIVEVVASAPKTGKEAEYNAWYEEHIQQGFKFSGLKKVTRRKCFLPIGLNGPVSPGYLTIYEFEKKEDLIEFYRQAGFIISDAEEKSGAAGGEQTAVELKKLSGSEISEIAEVYWAAGYDTVTVLQK